MQFPKEKDIPNWGYERAHPIRFLFSNYPNGKTLWIKPSALRNDTKQEMLEAIQKDLVPIANLDEEDIWDLFYQTQRIVEEEYGAYK